MDRDHSSGVVLGGVGGTDRHDRYDRYDVGRVSVDYGSHHRSDPPPLLSGSFSSAGVGATSHGGSVHGGSLHGGGAYSGDSSFDGCVAMMVAASEASAREEEAQMRQQEAEARLSASAAPPQPQHETARDGALERPASAGAVASTAPAAAAPSAAAVADEADEADAAAAAEAEMAAAALLMSSSRRHADTADDVCEEGEGGDYGSEDGAHDGDEDADDSAYDGASSGGSRRRRHDGERDGEHDGIIPYQPRSSSSLYEEACEALSSELNMLEAQIRELQSMQTARLKRDVRLLDELTVGVRAKLMRTQHGQAPGMAPVLGYGAQHGAQMPLGLSPPPLPRVATNGRPSYGHRSAHHGA
jgi:hypothetical protein